MIIPNPFSINPLTAMYAIGTILHGKSAAGNLWIVTQDQTHNASLLFDGKTKTLCSDRNYKRDRMSLGMRIASPAEVASLIGGWGLLPSWASNLILNIVTTSRTTPVCPIQLPPPALIAVDKALGGIITDRQKLLDKGLIKVRELDVCPSIGSGAHEYRPYYGFTDTYEYCIHCDTKRGMPPGVK